MKIVIFILSMLFVHYGKADCYKFAGKVVKSSPGFLTLQIENTRLLQLQFDDSQYNPRIPNGVLVVGQALGESGLWKSNKHSIDIPSRSVATYKLYLEKAELKDKSKCLKNSQN